MLHYLFRCSIFPASAIGSSFNTLLWPFDITLSLQLFVYLSLSYFLVLKNVPDSTLETRKLKSTISPRTVGIIVLLCFALLLKNGKPWHFWKSWPFVWTVVLYLDFCGICLWLHLDFAFLAKVSMTHNVFFSIHHIRRHMMWLVPLLVIFTDSCLSYYQISPLRVTTLRSCKYPVSP